MLRYKEFISELVNLKPTEFQQRQFSRKDPRENRSKRQKMRDKLAGAALDRKLGVKKPPLKTFKDIKAERDRVKNEEIANVTGTGVVGTGDDPVHWKKKRKSKIYRR